MPVKLTTVCYVHEITERLTQEFTVKEITAIVRLDDADPTKVVYLKVKIFIPSDENIPMQIEDFEKGNVVLLRGKFVTCSGWYSVNVTSLKVMGNLDFDMMPSIGLDIMVIGITTKMIRNVDGKSVLDFYVEENLGDREPRDFWVEVRHDPNNVSSISLSFNLNVNRIPDLRVPTCESCKKPSTRFPFSHLSPLPEEILSISPHRRRYLSFVFLHCSLRKIPNSNPYSQYRTLTSAMNNSCNVRAYALYSDSLGAFLDSNEYQYTDNGSSYDETLHRVAAWLASNNPYLRPFTNILTSTRDTPPILFDPFPIIRHLLSILVIL
ncbi:hypothetical protein C1646_796503 [Rhizophagus diaphanus]|nr:hypothetical protein C1646_796503 [Rhizophagus diaphanus] [Rhizophagus sp. MUCL 43196]